MRSLYTYLIALAILLGCQGSAQAQASLGMYLSSVSNSTPPLNSQISVATFLKNYSTTDTFTGIIDFRVANQDSIITDINVIGKPNYTGTSIKLAPLEAKAALFTVQLLPSHFKAGPDIIIVWPVATANIVDSARAPIAIQIAAGISDMGVSEGIYVSDDLLMIKNTGLNNSLQRVRIFDVTGQLVLSSEINAGTSAISLRDIPNGVYIAEISSAGSICKRVKFVR